MPTETRPQKFSTAENPSGTLQTTTRTQKFSTSDSRNPATETTTRPLKFSTSDSKTPETASKIVSQKFSTSDSLTPETANRTTSQKFSTTNSFSDTGKSKDLPLKFSTKNTFADAVKNTTVPLRFSTANTFTETIDSTTKPQKFRIGPWTKTDNTLGKFNIISTASVTNSKTGKFNIISTESKNNNLIGKFNILDYVSLSDTQEAWTRFRGWKKRTDVSDMKHRRIQKKPVLYYNNTPNYNDIPIENNPEIPDGYQNTGRINFNKQLLTFNRGTIIASQQWVDIPKAQTKSKTQTAVEPTSGTNQSQKNIVKHEKTPNPQPTITKKEPNAREHLSIYRL